LTSQEADEDDQYILIARLDNARTLSNILKAIHFKDTCIIFASENGLKVTTEDAKCVQANAFVQAGLFSYFIIREEQTTFKVNLTTLLDCLNIFGSSSAAGTSSNPALKMCYGGYGSPLILLIEENGVITDCSLKTQEPEETLDFNFNSANVVNKLIMKSECLKEAFSEIDGSSEVLEFLMSPDKPHFRMSAFGNTGSYHSDVPKDSDMVESFQCSQTQTNRYKVSLLKPSVKALILSSRISIRTDQRGFLSMQYMIKTDDGQVAFVEYFCAPDEEVADDQ